ncbi:hypothetical protein TBLA_0C01810 [Henningerozyma blattae CBS 6284]|uniref:Autophagy protein 5 n=1 Tax=Henningerozyma blattae (strain ATCC 34711 / CBS 6284 / DSM 70876 / NBRC 10599 / NRRL Y-10934 / UCD 77-7) TaxID=1071380 RepID=I2H0U2_HENB6|nr:hypothetical protein TBLA_0C01810 [Tetrapisispora blattae CBS 6284]CCH59994.1 hypothetical protein TBLA_0C01810 [Tetrapisispora blattae CBS 6284]
MNVIQNLLWQGSVNVQIIIDSELLLPGVPWQETIVNLRLPRNSYLILCIPLILKQTGKFLKLQFDSNTYIPWFEFENVPVYWNYPIGILFDTLTGLDPAQRDAKYFKSEDMIYYWKLQLGFCSITDCNQNGIIPFQSHESNQAIKKYWIHQWKQACFILNGNSKKIMSFSNNDIELFWQSILERDPVKFMDLSNKIIPKRPHRLPIVIYQILPTICISNPVVIIDNTNRNFQTVFDLMKREFPNYFLNVNNDSGTYNIAKVISNGIEIPLEMKLLEFYLNFKSMDGFLYISLSFFTQSN